MSHLFEFNGAKGQGYSQPAPVLPESSIALPESLARKALPRWPRLSEQKWFDTTPGFRRETLELIQDSIHLVRAQ